MNSFKLTAVGNLARNPELTASRIGTFARFCLVGHDSGLEDGPNGRKHGTVTSLWFFAFGDIATEIVRARKGDQLILEARAMANDWCERDERQKGHTFIVTGFRFGAKRGDQGTSAAIRTPPEAPPPASDVAEVNNEASVATAASSRE